MEKQLSDALKQFLNEDLQRIVLSNSRDREKLLKVQIRPVVIQESLKFQAEEFSGNQVFHKNLNAVQTEAYVMALLEKQMKQMDLKSSLGTVQALVSKKGKMTVKVREKKTSPGESPKISPLSRQEKLSRLAHNRSKRYVLEEGTPVPFLVDLGVMTAEGQIVRSRYDKFRQINRFLEFVEDVLPRLDKSRETVIIDFGCGKSYLTFAMYYYLKEKMGYPIRIIGLDLKREVIRHCNELSHKYGYETLQFYHGDIAGYEGVSQVDMVVTLHACDTATDYALAKAVRWGAKVILSVPCCQHELNTQMKNELLDPVFHYGIIKERMAALYTDALRAEVLENQGYRTQLLEFIDMEHTPKNILIRAVYQGSRKDNEKEIREITKFLHIKPALCRELLPVEENEGKGLTVPTFSD